MTCWLCRFETTKAPICKNKPCQTCAAVTEVDEEINQVVATLRRLLVKRSDILSEHNRVHETPIHRLPVELKNRIFELLLPPRDEWGEIVGIGMQSFLATMSLVCRGWRDVALSNPFLWSTMYIFLKTPDSSSGINDLILRSRELPLTLHVDVGYTPTLSLFDILNHCSSRLQSLSLYVPLFILADLRHFQYRHLTRLRITLSEPYRYDHPLSLLNLTASPEKIELSSVSFRSLQVSWSRLISISLDRLDLEEITQLFQQASQLTFCQVSVLACRPDDFSMPPIIHHRLKTLNLGLSANWDAAPDPLGSLTLPCLQEVVIYNAILLLTQLPALVRRSSCPLTRLTLFLYSADLSLDELRPLPGVTDLVIGACTVNVMMILLLDGYFPDLRHLTLRFEPFKVLWDTGVIPSLLDRKRPRQDDPNGGRLHKFIVLDHDQGFALGHMWNSEVGEQLKELNVTVREDGFEFF